MSVKEHLEAFHKAAATHHQTMAKSHERLAGHFKKASGMDGNKDIADEHQTMADSHEKMAQHHLAMCKAVGDSMNKGDGGDRLVPDRIQGVLREFPGTTLVPRAGQPDVNTARVPEEFRHLIAVEDDLA